MKKRIVFEELENYIEKEIEISAFVENVRNLQYVIFIILRDETGKLQVTIEKSEMPELVKIVENLTNESVIKVKGILKSNDHVKLNQRELIPSEIEILSLSESVLPIDINDNTETNREMRLDYRFLDLRKEKNNLLFKYESFIQSKMREYWTDNNYREIHTPKVSAAAAESGAEMFKLDYFGQKACLSQSPQFYKQMLIASGFNRVFEMGPVFRAENSHTSYHATEIYMLDAEIGWINSYEDVMDEEESWIKYFMNALKEKYGEEIKEKFNIEVSDVSAKFPRINFYEAKKIMKEKYNYVGVVAEDFERHEEELMCKYAKEKYNSDFVFITNYPKSARSFYIMRDENDITQSYDLLFKGLEITSGGQREHRPDVLTKNIIEKGIDPKDLQFYIDFFRYGCPPHGGFGVGLARIIMRIFEIDNIREATLIYRGPTRLNP